MNEYDIKRLGLILSVQAEIEGMKAENQARKPMGSLPFYNEIDFIKKAEELRIIVYKHPEEL